MFILIQFEVELTQVEMSWVPTGVEPASLQNHG